MHELSLAESMIKQLDEIIDKEGASEAIRVTVSIGALSGVERDALEFALPLVAEGTHFENTEFEFEEVPVKVKCGDCGKISFPEVPMMICMECSSSNIELIEGNEFIIKNMEIV